MVYISLYYENSKQLLPLRLPRRFEKRCLVIIQDPALNIIWSWKIVSNQLLKIRFFHLFWYGENHSLKFAKVFLVNEQLQTLEIIFWPQTR